MAVAGEKSEKKTLDRLHDPMEGTRGRGGLPATRGKEKKRKRDFSVERVDDQRYAFSTKIYNQFLSQFLSISPLA